MSITVLVVDDQELVRTGFKMILSAEPDIEVVGEAENGLEAVGLAIELDPDVILMDIRMPVLDGLQATRKIAASPVGSRVLVLTTFDPDEYVFEALRAGASGFLLKDTPADKLIQAVRVIAAGDSVLSPSITRRIIAKVATSSSVPLSPLDGLDRLTAREGEVLELVAAGLSNAEVAERSFISEATVKTHVSHLLAKLGVRDRVHLVIYAYEAGLVSPSGIIPEN